jgi:2-polyprenyl-3-methyl-5-hydroxy-6-metoxy-1,4-benzoquinol methylase
MSGVLQALERLDVRIPRWDLAHLRQRPCPLCGRRPDPLFVRPDGLPVAYCRCCGLWYVCEAPAQSAILAMYRGYWKNFRPRDLSRRAGARMLAEAKVCSRRDARILRLGALLGGLHGRRVLDVGCGLGQFLLALRQRGAQALGTEVSPEACRFVGGRLGIPVSRAAVEEWDGAIEPVDAVAMNDFIEHVVDPMAYIRAARRLLRPQGLLLLLTPNGAGAGEGLATARKWVGFRVDLEHLQYFSARTVQGLAREELWHVEHLETFGFPALKGKDRPPREPRVQLRAAAQRLPLVRVFARAARAIAREFAPRPDPRAGAYHLLCILRKVG